MSRDFAIGCMRGGAWAFAMGAFLSFMTAVVTLRPIFLWLTLGLELAVPLFIVLRKELEKEGQ